MQKVTAEDLVQMMEFLESLERLIMLNQMVANGETGDLTIIQDIARANALQLNAYLEGTRLFLAGDETSKEALALMTNFVEQD